MAAKLVEILRKGRQEGFIPRREKFVDLLNTQSRRMVRGASVLHTAFGDWDRGKTTVQGRLDEIRHATGETAEEISQELSRPFAAFRVPLLIADVAEVKDGISRMVDATYEPANYMVMQKIAVVSPALHHFSTILVSQINDLAGALSMLTNGPFDRDMFETHLDKIRRSEEEADELEAQVIGSVLEQAETINELSVAVRMQHVYKLMESATDEARRFGSVLRGIGLTQ